MSLASNIQPIVVTFLCIYSLTAVYSFLIESINNDFISTGSHVFVVNASGIKAVKPLTGDGGDCGIASSCMGDVNRSIIP